eukprot:UN16475
MQLIISCRILVTKVNTDSR